MNILIVYLSKHRNTEKYARWINEEVRSTLKNIKDTQIEDLEKHEIILFASRIYKDRIQISSYIEENWDILQKKEILLVSDGITDPEDEKTARIYEESLPKHIRDRITYYPLKGSMYPPELSLYERVVLFLHKKKQKYYEGIRKEELKPIIVELYRRRMI